MKSNTEATQEKKIEDPNIFSDEFFTQWMKNFLIIKIFKILMKNLKM